ncbi:MAG: Non-canonical purine NTP pyrophosphatase [Candidatus Gottesmanbacteria bacterium GW2011_GWC2_39_8]|uniref:Non-canonical purine NTP pyrophosphatase n=1 Tax=Candidatus Gottesmanbacteria bacterium GW2011_GWC2_39_8 TaxID=1618450 RepID=A0A0G0Q2K7_9BACT|nr:MAG: Non-canonical purine NTP pyrophosphatase [Candidatus Gottesmanbacteria bacterium GW2011_GWC2_39_8]
MKTLIATTNPAKLAEIKSFLSDLPLELVSLKDVGINQDVEETGKTFEENAIIKGKFFCKLSGLPTIADDGGIEIDALNGEPGVYSRRWAGEENTLTHDTDSDERLINYTLKRMQGIPSEKRGAQMRVVEALVLPTGEVFTGEGIIRGVISEKPSEQRYLGFPFRSLFFIPELNKFYNHDSLTKEENERYNHRKKALDKIKNIII